MDKFYFYSSYARPICKLNHNEAGQVIKAMCAFIFHDKEPSEKTLPKAKALFYLLYEQLSEAKKKQIKFFPDVYKDRIGKSYNDYIAGHQMNLFEDFIGYQGSAVLDEPEQKTDTISVPILQCEEPENIPLPDLQEQPENVQRPGSEVVEKGMLT